MRFFLAICCLGLLTAPAGAQPATGSLRGTVADRSGGVLPGVTVTATSPDGKLLATAVTDAVGVFTIAVLPAGQVHIAFELEGFSTAAADVAIQAGVEARATEHLQVAGQRETVTVTAKAPPMPVAPPRVDPPAPPPPEFVATPVPPHDHESVCGPAKPDPASPSVGTIRAVRRGAEHAMYAKGDELSIEGGTAEGISAGQNFVARRAFAANEHDVTATPAEHTAGLLQIVAASDHASTAIVIYACDEILQGDVLGPFHPEPIRTPQALGQPDFDAAARILFADAGQMLGAPGRSMVIDRGNDYGLRAGQRLTLFRRDSRRSRPTTVGDAVVVAVRADSATIRLVNVTDVVEPGDFAAPQLARQTKRE